MSTNVQTQGEVLNLTRQNFADGEDKNIQMNSMGAVLAALPLPINSEIVRQGYSFVAGTATAVAPVATIPTTAAHFLLFNGAAQTGNGKSLVIHTVSSYTVVSAGAAIVLNMLAHNSTLAVASIPAITAATGIKSLNGGANTSVASVGSAGTIVNNGIWHPIGNSIVCAGTANIALGTYVDTNGLYVVPPGGIFSLAMLCSAAASATCSFFVTWSEVLIENG